ncbi:hypothetical protein J7L48_03240 [bacterium]|nr:hypothetical protein [bacterium]
MNSIVLLIVLPLVFAFLIPIFKGLGKYASKIVTILSMLTGMGFAVYFFITLQVPVKAILGGWKPPFGIVLVGDKLSLLFVMIIYILAFLNLFFFDNNFKEHSKFYTLYNIAIAGTAGMILTGDIFNMFVFIEITGIALYSLIAYSGKEQALKGSIKYLIIGSMTSLFLLLGVTLAYHILGSLNLAHISSKFYQIPNNLKFLILSLIFTSFFVEAEIFPFNMWVPNAYKGANIPIAALLAGIVSIAAGYLLFRFRYLYGGMRSFGNMLVWFGVITVVIGEFSAYFTYDLRKILAFSSIGQMGLILIAAGISNDLSVYGGFFQILSHSIAKMLLFLLAGFIIYEAGTENVKKMGGFGKNHPYLTGIFLIGALSLAGIPGLMGFWGKFNIVGGGIAAGRILPISIVLLAAIAESVYLIRVVFHLFKTDEGKIIEKKKIPLGYLMVVILLSLTIVVIGVYPQLLNQVLNDATKIIMNSGSYIRMVLG